MPAAHAQLAGVSNRLERLLAQPGFYSSAADAAAGEVFTRKRHRRIAGRQVELVQEALEDYCDLDQAQQNGSDASVPIARSGKIVREEGCPIAEGKLPMPNVGTAKTSCRAQGDGRRASLPMSVKVQSHPLSNR
jgi:hypothetical protein